jgi:uncharacterized protein (DUF697 family)
VAGLPLGFGTLRALQKELTVSANARKPLIVGGARALVPALRRELGISGNEDVRGAAVYVHIWAGDGSDEEALKRARRERVPIVALAPASVGDVPFVLATDVVPLQPGAGFPVEALAERIAGRLGEEAAPLAARVPVLRRAVAEQLIASFARKNAIVAAAVFIPRAGSGGDQAAGARRRNQGGADLPILVRNQVRMLLRLEQAYGLDPDPRERMPEVLATIAAGFGLRAVAREVLDLVPPDDAEGVVGLLGRRRLGRRRFQRIAGWAVQCAVAYTGTRALGEAALRRVEMTQRGHR